MYNKASLTEENIKKLIKQDSDNNICNNSCNNSNPLEVRSMKMVSINSEFDSFQQISDQENLNVILKQTIQKTTKNSDKYNSYNQKKNEKHVTFLMQTKNKEDFNNYANNNNKAINGILKKTTEINKTKNNDNKCKSLFQKEGVYVPLIRLYNPYDDFYVNDFLKSNPNSFVNFNAFISLKREYEEKVKEKKNKINQFFSKIKKNNIKKKNTLNANLWLDNISDIEMKDLPSIINKKKYLKIVMEFLCDINNMYFINDYGVQSFFLYNINLINKFNFKKKESKKKSKFKINKKNLSPLYYCFIYDLNYMKKEISLGKVKKKRAIIECILFYLENLFKNELASKIEKERIDNLMFFLDLINCSEINKILKKLYDLERK